MKKKVSLFKLLLKLYLANRVLMRGIQCKCFMPPIFQMFSNFSKFENHSNVSVFLKLLIELPCYVSDLFSTGTQTFTHQYGCTPRL